MKDLTPRQSDLDPIEIASRDEIEALQLQRMQWSVCHAYENVGHYRKRFDDAGAHPSDLASLSDLAKFPMTVKGDFRANYPFSMLAVPKTRLARVHASSGTTGKPTVVGYTANDLNVWADCVARSMRAGGTRPGDVVHIAYGYGLFTGGLGAQLGADRLGCTAVPVSGGMTPRQVQLIEDFAATTIMVTPSYMLAILEEYRSQGRDPAQSSLEVGIFGAEPWTDSMRNVIEGAYDMHAVDIYGLSEIMGPGVASECVETKDGPHVWEDHFYPEIIDPQSGDPVADGEIGELVFTTLSKEAQPVIRYRTRDLSRLLPGTARSMRRIQKISGRLDDMIILRGVNLYPSQIEDIILTIPGLTPHFQIELSRDGPMDRMSVNVEAHNRSADASARSALSDALRASIKARIGVSSDITVAEPGQIPRSLGKAVRIVDKRSG